MPTRIRGEQIKDDTITEDDIHDDHESDYTYRLFKHKFYKKYGDLGEHGEMILFHGTDKCNIQGILNDDEEIKKNRRFFGFKSQL